jgi:hypothetical protein
MLEVTDTRRIRLYDDRQYVIEKKGEKKDGGQSWRVEAYCSTVKALKARLLELEQIDAADVARQKVALKFDKTGVNLLIDRNCEDQRG